MIWHHVSKIHEYMARTAGERKGTRQGVAQDQGAAQGDVDEKLKVPDNSDQVPFGLLVFIGILILSAVLTIAGVLSSQ